MKKTLTLIIIICCVYSCNKKTTQPQQQVVTNNQTANVTCDTINCLEAQAQGTYTFSPYGYDTLMTVCKVRVTYDGKKDSVPVIITIGTHDSIVSYQLNYWYKITPVNFNAVIQTTVQSKNRITCTEGETLQQVSFYTKTNKRAIFHYQNH